MAKKQKEVRVAEILGGLTREQAKALAEQFNGGLGSGMTPEEWKRAQAEREAKYGDPKKK